MKVKLLKQYPKGGLSYFVYTESIKEEPSVNMISFYKFVFHSSIVIGLWLRSYFQSSDLTQHRKCLLSHATELLSSLYNMIMIIWKVYLPANILLKSKSLELFCKILIVLTTKMCTKQELFMNHYHLSLFCIDKEISPKGTFY